jgi:hypothetical protein
VLRLTEDGDLAVRTRLNQGSRLGNPCRRHRLSDGAHNRRKSHRGEDELEPDQMSPAPLIPCFLISNKLDPTTSITSTSWMTAARPALRAAGIVDSCFQEEVERPCISLTNCTHSSL